MDVILALVVKGRVVRQPCLRLGFGLKQPGTRRSWRRSCTAPKNGSLVMRMIELLLLLVLVLVMWMVVRVLVIVKTLVVKLLRLRPVRRVELAMRYRNVEGMAKP